MSIPIAEKIDHVITLGKIEGDTTYKGDNLMNPPVIINDPYFWMRDDARKDEKVLAHIANENEYTDSVLHEHQDKINNMFIELQSHMNEEYDTHPHYMHSRKSQYRYFTRYEKGQPYSIECRINDQVGETEILLDKKTLKLPTTDTLNITNFATNFSEDIMSYCIDYTGNEKYELRLVCLKSKKIFAVVKDILYGIVIWTSDRQLYYTMGDEANLVRKLYRLDLDNVSMVNDEPNILEGELVYEETYEDFALNIGLSSSNKYLFIESGNYEENKVLCISIGSKEPPVKLIDVKKGVEHKVDHNNGYFYVHTNDGAPNWKIDRMAEEHYGDSYELKSESWIPHRNDIYINTINPYDNYFVFDATVNGSKFCCFLDYDKKNMTMISHTTNTVGNYNQWINSDLSSYISFNTGNVSRSENPADAIKFDIMYQSMTSPYTIFSYDIDSLHSEIVYQKVIKNYDESLYESHRIWVPFAESNESWPLGIPVSIVHKKNLDLNKSNALDIPIYLYGYGSYGITIDSDFNANILPFLDADWIYCIAHVRGGGFMGDKWYRDGKLFSKMNTFNDFIKVAEYFKEKGHRDITIEGRSAGGLLMGACMTMRPDLFKTVVAGVPFVDIITTMCDPSIPLTVEEWSQWGNPNESEGYAYIKQYCPVTNIRHVDYPNLYIQAGLFDPRVGYWEPLKFLAKLREYRVPSDTTQIIRMDVKKGHFGGSDRYNRLKELAEEYIFVMSR